MVEDDFQLRLLATLVLSTDTLSDFRSDITPDLWSSIENIRLVSIILDLYDKIKQVPSKGAILDELNIRSYPVGQIEVIKSVINIIYSYPVSEIQGIYRDKLIYLIKQVAYTTATGECIKILRENKFDLTKFEKMDNLWTEVKSVGIGYSSKSATDVDDYQLDIDLSENSACYGRNGQIKTGYPTVDNILKGGPASGELHLCVGKPNTGKTRYMINLACNAWVQGAKVAHISCEMHKSAVIERFYQCITHQTVEQLHTSEGRDRVSSILSKVNEKGGCYIVWDFDPYSVTMNDIENAVLSSGVNFDILITDYIDLILPYSKSTGNYWTDQTLLYSQARKVARRLNCIHHTVCQPVDSVNDLIGLSQASGSKGKGATVDFMCSLNSTVEQQNKGIQIGFCGKNRYGEVNSI